MVWIFLLLITLIAFLFLQKEEHLAEAMYGGFILAVVDVVFQSFGEILGLWTTTGSILKVFGAPLEVLLIAFFGATIFLQYLPDDSSDKILYVLIASHACTVIEIGLIQVDVLSYAEGWNSLFCMVSYFVVLSGIILIYERLILPKV